MGVFYPRHGDGGLIVQRDGYRRGGVGDEEIVLAPDGGAAARRQRPGDAILQSRRRRTLAGEIDQFCKRRRLRKRGRRGEQKKDSGFHDWHQYTPRPEEHLSCQWQLSSLVKNVP